MPLGDGALAGLGVGDMETKRTVARDARPKISAKPARLVQVRWFVVADDEVVETSK